MPSQHLTKLIQQAAVAPFASDLLEADPALWGSFWQFDVIAPGYLLPADELAFLRATRLDQHWPAETTLPQFLGDLRRAILHPQAGIWTTRLADQSCLLFVAPILGRPHRFWKRMRSHDLATMVWYCLSTGQIHAGYRAKANELWLGDMVQQRQLGLTWPSTGAKKSPPAWLKGAIEQLELNHHSSLAARLDVVILRRRLVRG